MKDRQARPWLIDLILGEGDSSRTYPHNSDLEVISGNRHICFEYENSSRGMVSHVCKHFTKHLSEPVAKKKILAFIRTDHHIDRHSSDHENAMRVARELTSDSFIVHSFNEKSFIQAVIDDLFEIRKVGISHDFVCSGLNSKSYYKRSRRENNFGYSSSCWRQNLHNQKYRDITKRL